jgi:hydroxyacylglutathione hydrolase
MHIDPISAFSDNYIWAVHHGTPGGPCAVVDPGDAGPVLAWLAERRLSLSALIITHHHNDHVGGIAGLLAAFPGIPVYGPQREAIPHRTHALDDGDTVTIAGIDARFKIWDVGGHTAAHIAYIGDGIAFVGDTLFAAGCGRMFEGTPPQFYASLNRLASLPDATLLYCAHEYTLSNLRFALAVDPDNPALTERAFAAQLLREQGQPTVPSRIDLERATNPFLRAHLPALKQAAQKQMERNLGSDVEVFAALREWKNVFH